MRLSLLYAVGAPMTDPTLTEALAERGYTHEPSTTHGKRHIVNAEGERVATVNAHEAWVWLRELPHFCSGCNKEIDPDLCHCGIDREHHNYTDPPHALCPMGCVCGYV